MSDGLQLFRQHAASLPSCNQPEISDGLQPTMMQP